MHGISPTQKHGIPRIQKHGMTHKKQKENGTNIQVPEADSLWSLVPSKYIEFIDHDLNIDFEKEMSRIQKEMKELLKEEEQKTQYSEEITRRMRGIMKAEKN